MVNPFADLAAELPRAAQRRLERKVARVEIKGYEDNDKLRVDYVRAFEQDKAGLLSGPYAVEAQRALGAVRAGLLANVAGIVAEASSALRAIPDPEARFLTLRLISQTIADLRCAEGLVELDDGLPFSDEVPSLFVLIREAAR
jgi:hypothetical protein